MDPDDLDDSSDEFSKYRDRLNQLKGISQTEIKEKTKMPDSNIQKNNKSLDPKTESSSTELDENQTMKDPNPSTDSTGSAKSFSRPGEPKGPEDTKEPGIEDPKVAEDESTPAHQTTEDDEELVEPGIEDSESEEETGQKEDEKPAEQNLEEENTAEKTLDDLAGEEESLTDPEVDNQTEKPPLHIPHVSNLSKVNAFQNYPPRNPQNSGFGNNRTQFHGLDNGGGGKKVQFLILGIVALLVIGATIYLLKGGLGNLSLPFISTPKSSPSPSPTSTEAPKEPEPAPQPVFDRSGYTVQVLNGTTKSGLAASVSAKLKELGYQTEKGANAKKQSVKRTEIKVEEGNTALLEQLIKDLSPDFEATSSGALKEADGIDAEITLGER